MAVPGLAVERIVSFSEAELDAYFGQFARYMDDAPPGRGFSYVVRVGSKALYSDDTYELKVKMMKYVRALRRRKPERGSGVAATRTRKDGVPVYKPGSRL